MSDSIGENGTMIKTISKKNIVLFSVIGLFIFLAYISFHQYGSILTSNLQGRMSKKQCVINEFGLVFACTKKANIQYWPNIFHSEFATVTSRPIAVPQTTDEQFYNEGIVIFRTKLEANRASITSAEAYINQLQKEESDAIKQGKLPTAPGPYTLIRNYATPLPRWTGAVTAKTGLGETVYVAIHNGYYYELRINPGTAFSEEEIGNMLSTLTWK